MNKHNVIAYLLLLYFFSECDSDFTQSCNVRSNILVPKDKEITSFNENHAHYIAIDNQFSNDYDSNETSNRFIQSSIASSKNEKEILEEEDVAESTIDPMHQNVINDIKYINREISSSNESAMEKITLDSDILSSRTNLSTNAQGFEQERYKDPLANSVKEESQSNGTDALFTPENKSNFPDILAFDGILEGIRDDMSKSKESNMAQIHSVVKVKRPAPNKRTNIYCKDCEHTFKSRMFYERHLKEDRCKHTCVLCGKVFLHGHTSNYKLHMKFHRKQRDYECYICKQKFIEKAKMELHVERHTNPKPKICEKCGKGFTTTAGLTEHMEHVHIKNRDKFQCSKCAKMYTRKSGLEYHMKTVHESDSNVYFSCDICDKSFKHKNNLRLHQHTHKTKEFKCNKCNASFKQNCHLLFHQRRHEKAYSMFCKTCNKGFYSRGKLVDHENIHTGRKPYQCSICDYMCACKPNLYKHMKIHRSSSNRAAS